MAEFEGLLRAPWGAEQWILEGWNKITAEEQCVIKNRIDLLFKDGLPFEIKSNKLLYIYTFSLLAQLEVLAIQVPLKFESRMSTVEFRERLRQQLLDELFHGLVFTKIVYMLCSPFAYPPPYNANIELLCNFIRNENCPKTAIMLLNLIGEGWIEEIFYSLERSGIAPKVFSVILEDEHRHVCEADLYRDIGMPDLEEIKPKIAYLEDQLLTNIFMQYKYMFSVCALLGVDGSIDFKNSLDKKHREQLKKVNLEPTENWCFFMKFGENLLPKINEYTESNYEIEMTPIRKVLMTQWDNPSDPTMAGEFNINVSCLDFFDKKFPPETLTTLMLQAVSLSLSKNDSHRSFVNFKKIYQTKHAYVGLVVKLPGCGDQLGTIVFENCHTLSFSEVANRIRSVINMMVYCYKKREELELGSAAIRQMMDDLMYEYANETYAYPIPGFPFVSLSNIGASGYSQCKSPLRCNESMKVSLMEVDRKQVWNKMTRSFEVQDILPVSISADHRLFDGNWPIPKLVGLSFNEMFEKMAQNKTVSRTSESIKSEEESLLMEMVEELISRNEMLGYKLLYFLQTYWLDFLTLEDLLTLINAVGEQK